MTITDRDWLSWNRKWHLKLINDFQLLLHRQQTSDIDPCSFSSIRWLLICRFLVSSDWLKHDLSKMCAGMIVVNPMLRSYTWVSLCYVSYNWRGLLLCIANMQIVSNYSNVFFLPFRLSVCFLWKLRIYTHGLLHIYI